MKFLKTRKEMLELLRRHRTGDGAARVVQEIRLTINGIAAGLRNRG